jgi:hypothetical protein
VLMSGEIIGVRDPFGFRPLSLATRRRMGALRRRAHSVIRGVRAQIEPARSSSSTKTLEFPFRQERRALHVQ